MSGANKQAASIETPSENRFQIYRLKALCERLMASAHYFEALDQLKRLLELHTDDIKTLLMLSRCCFNLKRYGECFDMAKAVRDEICQNPGPAVRDLILEADECRAAQDHLSAVIFLWSAFSIYLADANPSANLDGVLECLNKIADTSWQELDSETDDDEEAASSGDSSQWAYFSVLYMVSEEMEIQLRGMSVADENRFTKVLMRCMSNKVDCLFCLKRVAESEEISQKCIADIERQFGSHANKLFVYCEFLHNVAFCSLEHDNYTQSAEYCNKALAAAMKSQPATAGEGSRRENVIVSATKLLNAFEKAINRPTGLDKIFRFFRK